MKTETTSATLFFRAPPDLVDALDRFVSESKVPEMTRARALRFLLAKALRVSPS